MTGVEGGDAAVERFKASGTRAHPTLTTLDGKLSAAREAWVRSHSLEPRLTTTGPLEAFLPKPLPA